MQNQTEIEIDGNLYRIGRLDAMQQFHIARRIAPILAALAEIAAALPAKEEGEPSSNLPENDISLAAVAKPIAEAVSRMSDADSEYVVNTCLGACLRQEGPTWARVRGTNGKLMYQDISLPELMGLTLNTIQENMGSFFSSGGGSLSSFIPPPKA